MSERTLLIATDSGGAEEKCEKACIASFQRLGARVEIGPRSDNCVRRLVPTDHGVAFWPPAPMPVAHLEPEISSATTGAPLAVVQAQGLPNLLHELVHAVLAGRLDDDHGFDYNSIPIGFHSAAGRRVLWDELACCVVSCAYLLPAEADGPAWQRVVAWFEDQIGIQPFFYGMQDQPDRFRDAVTRGRREHGMEWAQMRDAAYERMAWLLRWAGASPEVACCPRHLDLDDFWPQVGTPS